MFEKNIQLQGNIKNGFFIIIKIFCGLYLGPPWVLFGVMESQFGDGFDLVGEVGVGVNAGGGDAGVAQELLGGEHVRTAADEVGAVGMAQFMGREVADGQFFEECFIPLKEYMGRVEHIIIFIIPVRLVGKDVGVVGLRLLVAEDL